MAVAGILIIGIIAGSIAFAAGQNSPTATLQRYCDGEIHQNASEVYNTLAGPGLTEAIVQQEFNALQAAGESITSCVVSNVRQDDSMAYGTLTETVNQRGNTEQISPTMVLKQVNGQWKIYGSM